MPFRTREGLRRSIETLGWRLEAYDNELWSILRERDTCEKAKVELEEALAAEPPSSDEEVAKKGESALRPYLASQDSRSEGTDDVEAEEDEDEEDELEESSVISSKAKGKGRAF